MDVICRFDKPQSDALVTALTKVEGWIGSAKRETLGPKAFVNGSEIPLSTFERPDVMRVHPKLNSLGFGAVIDLRDIVRSGPPAKVTLELRIGGQTAAKHFTNLREGIAHAEAWERVKSAKQRKLLGKLQCPVCRHAITELPQCRGCGARYTTKDGTLDMLPPEMRDRFRISDTSNISAHGYSREITNIICNARKSGGIILDCGAGYRFDIHDDIVCLEVVPYPSTDILAVGQSLPFMDNSFDVVLSSAVLEHVTDPFRCALELIRVLRPGGTIFCTVPFLQPEHGFPNHYYNMTMEGLANLFADRIEITERLLPDWGHPLHSLSWFLSEYLRYLPAEHGVRLRNMTVRDLMEVRKNPRDPIFAQLSADGRRILASATAIIATKRQS